MWYKNGLANIRNWNISHGFTPVSSFLYHEFQDSSKLLTDIVTTTFTIASAARKTVENTLGNMVNSKQIRRPKKGVYALNPKDIQKLSVPDHYPVNTLGKSSNSSYIN